MPVQSDADPWATAVATRRQGHATSRGRFTGHYRESVTSHAAKQRADEAVSGAMQQLDSHHQPPFYRLLLLTSAVATAQLDKDVDGDGVPNVSDPHPLIMKVPDFTWKVEGMVLTREINRE